MSKRTIRIYIIPPKPVNRAAYAARKPPRPDLSGLSRFADEICRNLFENLETLGPDRIRRVSPSRKGSI
jgi:hypothetical protein